MSRSRAANGPSTVAAISLAGTVVATQLCPTSRLRRSTEQLSLAVDRVMTEGSLYDRELASLAIKQARGDLVEAIFLLRAYRTTLPRFGAIASDRHSSGARPAPHFGDVQGRAGRPGAGANVRLHPPTARLFSRVHVDRGDSGPHRLGCEPDPPPPRVLEILGAEGLIELEAAAANAAPPPDLTGQPLEFPASRAMRLQSLARGDEGFLLALGYSTQRGYGRNHPFAGEIRIGEVEVEIAPEELGFAISIGDIVICECEMVNQFKGSATQPAQFTRGYGLVFGENERKAMAMALVDRSLRAAELGEEIKAPAQDQEFVLYHADNVEASGFVQHLKLPHYVDFQSELDVVRKLRQAAATKENGA